MRAPALVLLLATLASGCGSASSLDDTQPVVTIPDDSKTTPPAPPTELSRDLTSAKLDNVGVVVPPSLNLEATPIAKKAAEPRYPAGHYCVTVDCP